MESASLRDYLHLSFCAPKAQLKLGRLLKRLGSLDSVQKKLLNPDSTHGVDELQRQLGLLNGRCKKCDWAIEKALEWQNKPFSYIICYEDPLYPLLLKEVNDPPPVLYLEGNPDLLSQIQIAIIGSRRASVYGLRNAWWLGQELSKLGVTVTSGMAAGIDSKAHEGALAQTGATVAVVGTGIDGCYPKQNYGLRQRIRDQGVVVSEFPLGAPPHAFHFPQRNRIISGLSRGVVVVEAGMKSGSLITARLAMEQDREVFALPGQITNPMAQGCHQLINDGVKLVQSVDDIAQEIGLWADDLIVAVKLIHCGATTNAERLILNTLKAEPATLDFLLASTSVPEQDLIAGLSVLEAKKVITFSYGRYSYCDRG
ncbi:MAG: DNA processing protein [Pseudohongiellaceae bacterium]|jgi:DNA processing protein